MNCPRCKALIKEGQMFCESCGMDLQLVPVYDPQVDAQMESARIGIAGDLADTQNIRPNIVKQKLEENRINNQSDITNNWDSNIDDSNAELNENKHKEIEKNKSGENIFATETDSYSNSPSHSSHSKFKGIYIPYILFGCICLFIVITIGVVLVSYKKEDQSYDYQVKKAEAMCLESNYQEMLKYAQSALDAAPNSSDAKMLIARAYEGLQESAMEEQVLREIIEVDSSYVLAYDYLVPLLAEKKQFDQIANILKNCDVQTVLDKYVDYLSTPPDFSVKAGTYDKLTSVKLIGAGNGQIFYTLDGNNPDNKCIHYITPIILDAGTYKLKACYYNLYGVKSEVVEADYIIHPDSAGTPFVELEAGYYKEPQFIVVDVPDDTYQVYYTVDGEDPTFESNHYLRPIPLPLGSTHYKFIMYNEQETPGEIVDLQYTYEPDVPISGAQATNLLLQALISAGIVADNQGHVDGMDGIRKYNVVSVIIVDTAKYYLFKEVFCAPDLSEQETGNEYAVDVNTGKSYLAVYSEEGGYSVSEIQNR